MTITYTGINHLAMVTGDMTSTIRFWRDLLGMRLVAGLGRPGYRHYFFEISSHDLISFFEWPAAEPMPEKDHGVPVKGPAAFDHVAVGVAADEDLWAIKERLESAGFWVSEVIDHGFIHSIYSFDPNQIPIEFSAPVASLELRSHPQMRDAKPLPAALEGSEPQRHYWPEPIAAALKEDRRIYPGEGVVFKKESEN
ncbi:MAG: VOC family protein [Desulfobacteraceae bacterium]|nr:VOC family protein [Desulfobacteraceae bacterium]